MQRIKDGESFILESKKPLTKGVFQGNDLQLRTKRINKIVILLKDNQPGIRTNFLEEANSLKKLLIVLPRGTLDELKKIL